MGFTRPFRAALPAVYTPPAGGFDWHNSGLWGYDAFNPYAAAGGWSGLNGPLGFDSQAEAGSIPSLLVHSNLFFLFSCHQLPLQKHEDARWPIFRCTLCMGGNVC